MSKNPFPPATATTVARAALSCVPITALLLILLGPAAATGQAIRPGDRLERRGDEIVVCGQLFHTTANVVLWMDPGGYDAYRVERRFAPFERSSWDQSRQEVEYLTTPNRYGLRKNRLTPQQIEQVRGGGWDLKLTQETVDQFVIHYDVCGTSRRCFQVLHDQRGLSVHFLLDIDGTIYQTLDLKERAWHATISNTRSVGVEIANIGAYSPADSQVLNQWYARNPDGITQIHLPETMGDGGVRTTQFVGRPACDTPVTGTVQGRPLMQYDFTPEQYESLVKLTATLCRILPKIRCDYPRDESGQLIAHKLPDGQLRDYAGVLGHYHIQANKVDPGPAFQWDRVIAGAQQLLDAVP